MGMIEFTGSEGSAWQPLPEGTYPIQLNTVKPTTSQGGNPQLRIDGEVYDGPERGKKVTIFYSRVPNAAWKLNMLLEAAIPGGYEKVDTGTKNEKGDPIFSFRFDSDHLQGAIVLYDVKVGQTPNGAPKNDFVQERPYERPSAGGAQEQKPAETQAQAQTQAQTAPAGQTEAAPAATQARRRTIG